MNKLTIQDELEINKKVNVGSDMAGGEAVIKVGDTNVYLKFENEYTYLPIVIVIPHNFINGSYRTTNKTIQGFTIEISEHQTEDVNLIGMHLDLKEAKEYLVMDQKKIFNQQKTLFNKIFFYFGFKTKQLLKLNYV